MYTFTLRNVLYVHVLYCSHDCAVSIHMHGGCCYWEEQRVKVVKLPGLQTVKVVTVVSYEWKWSSTE